MYEVFYNLKAEPFRLSPDHKFCYEHKGYAKARAYMAYAFKRAEGFVMITGRPGTGKTTLIGELVESLANDNVRTANLVCTQLQADDLLKTVAFNFGIGQGDFDKAQLLQRLTTLFHRWHQEGGRALLIVDEAQDLSSSAMEELRLLTNIQVGGQPLIQIFLLGQPELRDLVMSPEMEQVHQRVIAASHLRGLEVDETEAYVAHRLHAVGWKGDPAIDRAIFPLIHKFSEGVPRRINLICSRLFLLCSVEQRHEVVVADVKDVIGELQAENLAAGSWFSEADFDLTAEPEWLAIPGQPVPPEPPEPDGDGGPAGAAGSDGDTSDTEVDASQAEVEGSEPDSPTGMAASDTDGQLQSGATDSTATAEQSEPQPDAALEVESQPAPEPDTEPEPESEPEPEQVAEQNPAPDTESVEAVPEALIGVALDASASGDAAAEPEEEGLSTADVEAEEVESESDRFGGPDASVEVIDELFEVVTSQEYVDLPDDLAAAGERDNSVGESESGAEGRRYFSGTVVAESALGSEEAVSELANMPNRYIDAGDRNLEEPSGSREEEAPLQKLDELQRDGKAWPTSSRPAPVVKGPNPRTSRAIAILALVAMVGAGVFFLELYLSQQDKNGGGSLLDRLTHSEAVPSAPQSDATVNSDAAAAEMPAAKQPLAVEKSASAATDMGATRAKPEQAVVSSQVAEARLETPESSSTLAESSAPVPDGSMPVDLDASLGEPTSETAPPESEVFGDDLVASEDTSVSVPVVKQVYVVNFDFDSSDIGQDADAVLGRALEKLQQYPASTATIARNARGQTPGTAAATMSEARAGAVAQYFLDEGVAPTRISIESVNGQELAASVPGRDSSRAVQVIVSRMLDS